METFNGELKKHKPILPASFPADKKKPMTCTCQICLPKRKSGKGKRKKL